MPKKTIIYTFTISVFLVSLLLVSINTGIPRSFLEMQNKSDITIQSPQSSKNETFSTQREESVPIFAPVENSENTNSKLEMSVAIPTHLLGLIRQYLAEQLDVSPNSVEVITVEEAIWPDTCLGLPSSELCAPGDTPGYRIIFRALGQEYIYRTNQEEGFRFEGPGDEPRRH